MNGLEIFLLILFIAIFLTGWTLFIIFYSYWQNPRLTPQDDAGWLRATIGLYLGIAGSVLLLIYTFIVGSREYTRKHAHDLRQKVNLVQQHFQNPIPPK